MTGSQDHRITGHERDYKRLQEITREGGGWFVTLHVRDSGYLLGKYGEKNDPNLYRNADIDSYTDAIKSIVGRGGYVVRVGDPKMKPMSEKIKGVFDYAHSSIRSNKMDIFLFSQCRFFIATTSGPWLIPCIFDVPTVVTNLLPLIRPWTKDSFFIPKILKLNNENRILTIKEMLSSEIGKFYTTRQYLEKNISIIDNTKEELNALVLEVLDYLDGSLVYSDEDNAEQNKLSNLYLRYSKFGDSGRMGRDFLKKHFSEQLFI
ncbi:glycosyltransferase, TIGR0xxxx family protein [Leptospira santarosai serovar Bananal]|nr:glycosyltransferase, TIGR0xxxx family protein [Leptospira santarosai serovar Grippotyphosa]ONF77377.1 glycosyltransferase, TIGR0xxxx family protein [Leptospira santarosai serovar Bananal]ONF82236.1 glycosyltransferase, TIGR0xxxx family protein [Leptospira santarosai serovar Grippotyphosa]